MTRIIFGTFFWIRKKIVSLTIVFLIFGMISLYWLVPIFGPIKPEKASRNLLITWLFVRDFQSVPPETLPLLMSRYHQEFGPKAEKRTEFQFSGFSKQQINSSVQQYQLLTQKQKKVLKYPEKLLGIKLPRQEQNLQILCKTWFVDKRQTFEDLSTEKRSIFMEELLAELSWWEDFYLDFLRAADLPHPTKLELLQNFEIMFARWKAEEDAKFGQSLERFKGEIQSAFLRREVAQRVEKVKSGFFNLFGTEKSQNANQ